MFFGGTAKLAKISFAQKMSCFTVLFYYMGQAGSEFSMGKDTVISLWYGSLVVVLSRLSLKSEVPEVNRNWLSPFTLTKWRLTHKIINGF